MAGGPAVPGQGWLAPLPGCDSRADPKPASRQGCQPGDRARSVGGIPPTHDPPPFLRRAVFFAAFFAGAVAVILV
jgi:hypothetical protein